MVHKCDGCPYKGEHQEMMFRPMGVCNKAGNLADAVAAYEADTCPYAGAGAATPGYRRPIPAPAPMSVDTYAEGLNEALSRLKETASQLVQAIGECVSAIIQALQPVVQELVDKISTVAKTEIEFRFALAYAQIKHPKLAHIYTHTKKKRTKKKYYKLIMSAWAEAKEEAYGRWKAAHPRTRRMREEAAEHEARMAQKAVPVRYCKHCGKPIEAIGKYHRVFCDEVCRQRNRDAEKAERKASLRRQEKECAYCGAKFTTTDPKRRFCSAECRVKDSNRRAYMRKLEKRALEKMAEE